MALYMPKPHDSEFTPPPAGTHIARCYRVIDLGTQQVVWQDQTKLQRKIMLSWELPNEKMEDGRPFSISKRYTFSSSEKAQLRKDLESWRGKKFQDGDFGPGGFHVRKLLGVPCLLNIVHNEKGDKVYANITAVTPPMKGMEVPAQVNENVYLSLDADEFDAAAFRDLSDGLRDIIRKSPEYHEIERKANGQEVEHYDERNPPPDLDDEIPF